MRVVITGATGNVGTALLHRLRDAPEVTSVTGIARRAPSPAPPYDRAEWVECDLGAPHAAARLAEVTRDATAVIHLAWDVLGTRRRRAQQRTNVAGTSQVLAAAIGAGVSQFVFLSSVAAYTPEPHHHIRVPEDWPRGGVPGSAYSADKVTAERMLDRVVAHRPELRVARLRPPSVLQPAAATEVTNYLLGPLAPLVRSRWLRPRLLPLPGGVTVQVVHAADVADLIHLALRAGAVGAYNVAAEPVVSGDDIAEALEAWRVPVPGAVLRAAMDAAAALRVQPLNGSWLEMFAGTPLMSTQRARRELGWRPSYQAGEVLRAVRAAAVAGAGAPSPALGTARAG